MLLLLDNSLLLENIKPVLSGALGYLVKQADIFYKGVMGRHRATLAFIWSHASDDRTNVSPISIVVLAVFWYMMQCLAATR